MRAPLSLLVATTSIKSKGKRFVWRGQRYISSWVTSREQTTQIQAADAGSKMRSVGGGKVGL